MNKKIFLDPLVDNNPITSIDILEKSFINRIS